ncbi:MAG: hypothetical protein KAI17_06345 [Thiotrichaceae bacterium]|nr:hypothetical protein [Thiotrichaceae bacterium]
MSILSMLFLCITSFASTVQAANMVVIHSNITQLFPRGQLLDCQTSINLPTDAKITVVFGNGNVQTVSGPFQGKIPKKESNITLDNDTLVTSLAQFVVERETIRELAPHPKELWMVDVSTSKHFYCIAPSSQVILWLPEIQSQSASTLVIKHAPTGEQTEIEWPAYHTTLSWPSSLPVQYGDIYTVKIKYHSRTTFKQFVLYQLPESLPTNSHKIVWMVGRGCIPQANQLLASLH